MSGSPAGGGGTPISVDAATFEAPGLVRFSFLYDVLAGGVPDANVILSTDGADPQPVTSVIQSATNELTLGSGNPAPTRYDIVRTPTCILPGIPGGYILVPQTGSITV